MLRVLDYSRVSRHLLVTAGDDGTVHLWDTTGRSPKVCNALQFLTWLIIEAINQCFPVKIVIEHNFTCHLPHLQHS